jgi:hypothetical protein
VETSVPFGKGQLREAQGLLVVSPEGQPVLTQTRVAQRWPDGSVRWLYVVFEAEAGPGRYSLQSGETPAAPALVREDGGRIAIDTGELVLSLPASGAGLLEGLAAKAGADAAAVIEGQAAGDLVLVRHDGKVFRASLAGDAQKVIVEERGPVRASVRLEGTCKADDGEGLFDYLVRWRAYRGRPEATLTVTWINGTKQPAEQLRDVRVVLPFTFQPNQLVFGCDTGVYEGPFLADSPVYLLQEDHDWYWAKQLAPDGRTLNLSTGGCNGEHCPGWLYVQNDNRQLGVWVPNFWQEYPNELSLKAGELSVGLWPERAAAHLRSKPILPREQEPGKPYQRVKYWPVLPHPYLAFFDADKGCLDVPSGVAKTQEIVLSAWAGNGDGPSFEKKWWRGSLEPVRGFVDPRQVAASQACGPLWPRDPEHFPEAERVFDECFGWFHRHAEVLKCYGKFDHGDFRYFTPSTTYMTHAGTKWGAMGEMPREGYWHNNERDPFRGLLLHYLRTGDPRAWELAQTVARHLLDVDLSHGPGWGMYTHTDGHCYLKQGAGAPDHAWLLGLLEWAGVSGDPVAWDWTAKCGEQLAGLKTDFSKTDLRTTAMQLHMMCQFYLYTGERKYLDAARGPAEALIKLQKPDGTWSAYLAEPERPHGGTFVEHAIAAIADYAQASGDARALETLKRSLQWAFTDGGNKLGGATAEAGLTMYGAAIACELTGDASWAGIVENAFRLLDKSQNRSPDPIGRGDFWATWGVNNPAAASDAGRPPQFTYQSRPLAPGTTLAYAPRALWIIARQKGLTMSETDAGADR